MNSNPLSHNKRKKTSSRNNHVIPDVMKVVEMAQTSGDVLVDVASDGRVTVRSVQEAVRLSLKKKLPRKVIWIIALSVTFFFGSFVGVLTDRLYLYDSFSRDNKTLISSLDGKDNSVLFSEYETNTLLGLESLSATDGTKGEDFFLMGDLEAAYDVWKREIFNLPDEAKVIVTGVYSSEATAFKVYKDLATDFRPILAKRRNQNAVQILILVPHTGNSNFEDTRKKLAQKLSIPLPKWNSAGTLKNRL